MDRMLPSLLRLTQLLFHIGRPNFPIGSRKLDLLPSDDMPDTAQSNCLRFFYLDRGDLSFDRMCLQNLGPCSRTGACWGNHDRTVMGSNPRNTRINLGRPRKPLATVAPWPHTREYQLSYITNHHQSIGPDSLGQFLTVPKPKGTSTRGNHDALTSTV